MDKWNYRILKRKISESEFEFGIYEVYYDENGRVKGYTENSLVPTCESTEGLLIELELMKHAFDLEVINYKE